MVGGGDSGNNYEKEQLQAVAADCCGAAEGLEEDLLVPAAGWEGDGRGRGVSESRLNQSNC